jgi:hypothetical protein
MWKHMPKLNISFAMLQTKGSSAAAAKLMLNLHKALRMEKMFGRFYRKVWPLSPLCGANFIEKTPGSYKKVWPSCRN